MSGYTARTAPRPEGDGWRRVPSVTYGGAPFFWFRRNPATDEREWYRLDRSTRQWVFEREARGTSIEYDGPAR